MNSHLRELEWPVYRNHIIDFLDIAKKRHHITGIWEADITHVLKRIRELQRETGIAISFNAYLVYVITRALVKHPEIQAQRFPLKRKVVVYEDVDFNTIIEQKTGKGTTLPVFYRVNQAQNKSLAEICIELRKASRSNLLEDNEALKWRSRLAGYPRFIRRLFWKWVDASPRRRKRIRGTFGTTNLNAFSSHNAPGFGFPLTLHTSCICIGATYDRLVPDNKDPRGFLVRKKLCLTMDTDHVVVDGAPAVRFRHTFDNYIESAIGLDSAFADELIKLSNK